MTDSESDTSNNFLTFQNVSTTVSARGPHTNITNLSFRNQPTSTMYMPRNFERQRYAESAYDQRSMYYRRETSPMSIHSACDIQQRHFQQYYPGMSSQRSMFNGRSGSSMSMRSIDSNPSVIAADIASAIKNIKFNKNDLKLIKDSYHSMYGSMKQRVRKRIEKRRKLFLKGSRRRSGDDSGEQGSNSSLSSDDCRSIKTYKENMYNSRSARIDLFNFNFRKTVTDSNLHAECSDNFKQNTFKNQFSVGSGSVNNTQNFNNTMISKHSRPTPTQKDKFRNGFLLPSQRFNRSVASSEIPETSENIHNTLKNNVINKVKNHYSQNKLNKNSNCPRESEEEEIFSEMTVREKDNFNIKSQRKRSFDSEEVSSLPERKKSRVVSPGKIAHKNKRAPTKLMNDDPSNNTIEMSNRFEFVKPTLPIKKSKPRIQQKPIAKSSQPLTDFVEPVSNKVKESKQIQQPSNLQEKSTENLSEHDQSETTQYNDVSMRPSFIKRKLFTQKLDVAEKANLSSDSTNSPQSNVYSLQKEKNKARKLVTNQSCLNREVQDDSNLLELIHKIVPLDSMNMTNQTTMNQTKADLNNRNKDNEDKWDITSVISMCNDDDVSDTYTDEEIFEGNNTKKNKDINSKADKETDKVLSFNIRDCKIMAEKIQINNTIHKQVKNHSFNLTHNNVTKSDIKSSAKSFWDTDFESDAECETILPRSYVLDNMKRANIALEATKQDLKNPTGHARNQIVKKSQQIPEVSKQLNNTVNNTVINSTIDSMRKFNTSTLSIRSHRTSKKKKCCNETCSQEIKSKPENLNQIPADIKKHNSSHPNKKISENNNLKTDVQIINSTDMPKSKLNTQKEKLANTARSTSQSKKSPKEKKTKKDKAVESPIKNTKKSESKSKPEKSNNVTNNRLKSKLNKHDNSAVKNKVEKKSEIKLAKTIHKPNTKNENQNNKKVTQNISPTNKPKSRTDRQNSSIRSKKNNQVSQPNKSNLDNTVEPKQKTTIRSDRPVRSCRTPSQNRSIELSKSSLLNNTSDANRSLRSRVINLSSSIENNTIKIKPRKKIMINNKNISQINTRKSDISFSLGKDKQTPTPKKNLARSRGDFFKGKRKT